MFQGRRLKAIRSQRGWSQRRLARALRIDQSAISLLENGRRSPHNRTLLRLLAALAVPAVYFYD